MPWPALCFNMSKNRCFAAALQSANLLGNSTFINSACVIGVLSDWRCKVKHYFLFLQEKNDFFSQKSAFFLFLIIRNRYKASFCYFGNSKNANFCVLSNLCVNRSIFVPAGMLVGWVIPANQQKNVHNRLMWCWGCNYTFGWVFVHCGRFLIGLRASSVFLLYRDKRKIPNQVGWGKVKKSYKRQINYITK